MIARISRSFSLLALLSLLEFSVIWGSESMIFIKFRGGFGFGTKTKQCGKRKTHVRACAKVNEMFK